MTIELTINGQLQRFDGVLTVAAMMAQMGLEARKVAIERNGAIVPRSQHGVVMLEGGDVVEIVEFIGGG